MNDVTPYRDAWEAYRSVGWVGILPLPPRRKTPPPEGWTGHNGKWPSYPDLHAWADAREGRGNIGLRLPHDVVGLDVDNYGAKHGGDTLETAERRWGVLPPTWRTTSRDDGISGIRLYTVAEGLAWPGELGPDTEIIQYGHRYAVVWPSVHPEGRTYRWINPAGATSTVIPRLEDLAELPEAWVVGLTGGEMHEHHPKAELSIDQTQAWLLSANRPGSCRRTQAALSFALESFDGPGSVHTLINKHILRLVRFAQQGHRGLLPALEELHKRAIRAATSHADPTHRRDLRGAEGEWNRGLKGAVALVVAEPEVGPIAGECACEDELMGLIASPMAVAGNNALAPVSVPVPDEASSDDRTSWYPRDLGPVITGDAGEPPPAVLSRDDGNCLFYPGKVNGLLGESESGKTWVVLLAVVQQLEQLRKVLYIDCEDTASGLVARLQALGAKDQAILDLFTYISPEESLHTLASADLTETLDLNNYGLIVLDGVNAGMTMLGLELESNTDATKFAQILLRPLSRTGAAVVTIDHVPKSKEARGKGGIGAQAKRAMVTGCALSVDVVAAFGRGTTGKLKLTVDKDRPGHVRGFSAFAKEAGTAILESNADTGGVSVRVEAPDLRPVAEREVFRPTYLMARISQFLSSTEGDLSQRAIEEAIEGKSTVIRSALEHLVTDGYVTRHPGARNAVLHRHVRVYRELQELVDRDEDSDY
jgi:hypothetical protein